MRDGFQRLGTKCTMDYDDEAREFYFYSVNAGCGIWFVFSPAFHKVLSRFSRGRDFECMLNCKGY